MAFVLEIERLGRAVEAGEVDIADAAAELIQSRDGGLSGWSAVYELRHWQTARARYDPTSASVVDLQAGHVDVNRWGPRRRFRAAAS